MGTPEILLAVGLAFVAVMYVTGQKLGRDTDRTSREFRKGAKELNESIDRHIAELRRKAGVDRG